MTLETILRTVLHAVAWSAFVVFCGVVAGVGVRWMLRLLGHAVAETGRRCGKAAAMTLASLALVCAVVAQKANTNAPPDGVSAPPPMMGIQNSPAAPNGTGSSVDSENLRERPSTACNVPRWEKRGASDDVIRIPATNWFFQTPDGFVEGMTVFSRGEFRPDVGTLYFPRPFTNDLSFLPQSKWELLPNGGESKLWYAATPSNSLLVTWVNGLLDRDPLTPTNFQAEFFPDGSYEYRYGDHSEPHPFVLPFDCDGDGLENTVDPDPETAGPDAHNTNAEWYNVVCSNVLTAVEGLNGMELSFRDGVNSNAYYFVDVCAEMRPAPIYFTADQEGRLGSPVVVATAGVTNRVPLLVGATYSVTSSVPFSVSVPTDGFAEVKTNAANEYVVNWPVRFDFRESLDSSGRSYTVYAEPYDPGGVFTWNGSGSGGGGARLMSASPGCGCASGNGRTVTMGCARECDCGGGCVASGSFGFEGIGLAVMGGVCRCGFDDPPPPDEPSHEPDDPASFSVTFSKSAVIYEDEYQDNPGVTVPKRSTRAYTSGLAPGVAGGLELRQAYRIHPLTVSFEELSIEEVPCDEVIPPQGYFAFTPTNIFLRSHTRGAGAGEWFEVTEGNWVGSESSHDRAGYLGHLPRMMPDGTATTNTAFGWLGGSLTWKVPFGWSKDLARGSTADPVDCFAEDTVQIFRVNADGDFSVEKLMHKAERKITDEVNVYNLSNQPE